MREKLIKMWVDYVTTIGYSKDYASVHDDFMNYAETDGWLSYPRMRPHVEEVLKDIDRVRPRPKL